jgi:hypothetical protein
MSIKIRKKIKKMKNLIKTIIFASFLSVSYLFANEDCLENNISNKELNMNNISIEKDENSLITFLKPNEKIRTINIKPTLAYGKMFGMENQNNPDYFKYGLSYTRDGKEFDFYGVAKTNGENLDGYEVFYGMVLKPTWVIKTGFEKFESIDFVSKEKEVFNGIYFQSNFGFKNNKVLRINKGSNKGDGYLVTIPKFVLFQLTSVKLNVIKNENNGDVKGVVSFEVGIF